MPDIRIGIIGSGGTATGHAKRFSQTDGFELAAIAARNPKTGPSLAQKHGADYLPTWEALIEREDIDAVVICTYNDTHSQIAIPAIEAGKHVFTEYPATRSLEEAKRLAELIRDSDRVVRVAHNDPISASHQALKAQVRQMGELLSSFFTRLTPGRGARPEILFNLSASGPPALFFVYHIYTLVDIFGPAAWVESGARYIDLNEAQQYDRFANTLTVEFQSGGLAQWNWSGGIEIQEAEEFHRIVFTGGTLIRESGQWRISTSQDTQDMPSVSHTGETLQIQFLQDLTENTDWRQDARVAIDAARIGLAAERSVIENKRIQISDLI